MLDIVAAVLLLAGAGLSLLAGIGLHRFNDVFARMHAATKPATLGLMLVVAGASLRIGEAGAVVKLLVVVAFQLVTAPVAAHVVARAAYRVGDQPVELVIDEYGEALAAEEAEAAERAGEVDEDD